MKNLTRRAFAKALGVGSLALAGCSKLPLANKKNSPSKNRPLNVVLINVDDLGWADLGCTGSDFYKTPNIDSLAKQGMRFTDAYAAAAVCSPTRAAIMTGQYPARIGITDWIRASFNYGPPPKTQPKKYVGSKKTPLLCPPNHYWLEHKQRTIAEALKQVGYATCHIGKWHLGADKYFPDTQGFDINIGGCDFGQPTNYFDPYKSRRMPEGFPTMSPRKAGEYLTDREADEAVKFIHDNKSKSFFLNLCHYAVHTPIQAKPALTKKYKSERKGKFQKRADYAAMIHSVDQSVGRVLNQLRKDNLEKNTLVIFTSDNGGLVPVTSNKPLRDGKGSPYEGGIRVPLIFRLPDQIKPNSVSHVPVCSIDFYPTICSFAGAQILPEQIIDGKNLGPILQSKKQKIDRALIWHFPHYRNRNITPYSIIRKGNWKLIRWYGRDKNRFELFNLKNDLGERKNLARQKTELTKRLDKLLSEMLEQCNAKLPKRNPNYQPAKKELWNFYF